MVKVTTLWFNGAIKWPLKLQPFQSRPDRSSFRFCTGIRTPCGLPERGATEEEASPHAPLVLPPIVLSRRVSTRGNHTNSGSLKGQTQICTGGQSCTHIHAPLPPPHTHRRARRTTNRLTPRAAHSQACLHLCAAREAAGGSEAAEEGCQYAETHARWPAPLAPLPRLGRSAQKKSPLVVAARTPL